MAGNYSINQKGATAYSPYRKTTSSVGSNIFGNQNQGVFGAINKATGMQNPVQSTSQVPKYVAPSTAVKSVTDPNGTKTEYHKPEKVTSGLVTPSSGKQYTVGADEVNIGTADNPNIVKMGSQQQGSPTTPANTAAPANAPVQNTTQTNTQAPVIDSFAGSVKGLMNTQNSPYNQIVTDSAKALQGLSQNNLGTSGPAWDEYQNAINEQNKLKADIAKQYGDIESASIPLGFQQGREQVLAKQYASQLAAAEQKVAEKAAALGYGIQGLQTQQAGYNQAGGLGISGQGQVQGALGTAAGLAAPQFIGTETPFQFNPVTGQYGNIGNGQFGNGVLAGTNITSMNEAQQAINKINQNGPELKNNFSILTGYSQDIKNSLSQAGLPTDMPLLQILNQIKSGTIKNDAAVNGFQTMLSTVRGMWKDVMGTDPSILDNVTLEGLQQIGSTLDAMMQNRISSSQGFIDSFNKGGSTGGSTGGSFTEGQTAAGGSLVFKNGKWVKA